MDSKWGGSSGYSSHHRQSLRPSGVSASAGLASRYGLSSSPSPSRNGSSSGAASNTPPGMGSQLSSSVVSFMRKVSVLVPSSRDCVLIFNQLVCDHSLSARHLPIRLTTVFSSTKSFNSKSKLAGVWAKGITGQVELEVRPLSLRPPPLRPSSRPVPLPAPHQTSWPRPPTQLPYRRTTRTRATRALPTRPPRRPPSPPFRHHPFHLLNSSAHHRSPPMDNRAQGHPRLPALPAEARQLRLLLGARFFPRYVPKWHPPFRRQTRQNARPT